MHNPHYLLQHAQENFGIVLSFAFSQSPIQSTINDQFLGEWKFLWKLACELPERRADRALMEMALQLRAIEDLNEGSSLFHNFGPVGTLIKRDGKSEPLIFREMTNKVIHAEGFIWEYANPVRPTVVCRSSSERWAEAQIELVAVMGQLGSLGF